MTWNERGSPPKAWAVAAVALMTACVAGSAGARAADVVLRGVVSAIRGDRVVVDLSHSDVLPTAKGPPLWQPVRLYQHAAGMQMEVEGNWGIVQVHEDSVVVALRPESGEPEAGLIKVGETEALIEPPYYAVQEKAEYRKRLREAEELADGIPGSGPLRALQTDLAAAKLTGIGDLDRARRLYEEALEDWRELRDIEYPDVEENFYRLFVLRLADILIVQGDLQDAEQILASAYERGEEGVAAKLGEMRWRRGDMEEATRWYRKAARQGSEKAQRWLEEHGP